jgi:hypothetical protein
MYRSGSAEQGYGAAQPAPSRDGELPAPAQQQQSPPQPVLASYDERRQAPRYHYQVQAVLQCAPVAECGRPPAANARGLTYTVQTKDISAGGLAFLHHEPISSGKKIFIRLPKDVDREMQVVRSRPVAQRRYEIGAHFVEELDPTFVSSLLRQRCV